MALHVGFQGLIESLRTVFLRLIYFVFFFFFLTDLILRPGFWPGLFPNARERAGTPDRSWAAAYGRLRSVRARTRVERCSVRVKRAGRQIETEQRRN